MKRFALTLAGLLAFPAMAGAQTGPVYTPEPHPQQLPHTRFAITPFIAARIPGNGSFYVTGENGAQLLVEEEHQGNAAVGLNVDVLLRGPFYFTAGAAYSGGGQDILTFGSPLDSLPQGRVLVDAPSMWFAKAGITARLPDPIRDDRRFHPSAFVTVAPAMVFTTETPGQEATQQFALNLGADATVRLGQSNFALQLGVEDYLAFWNNDDFVARDAGRFAPFPAFEEGAVTVDYNSGTRNILLARFGVSYRPGRRAEMAMSGYTAPPPPPSTAAAANTTAFRYCVVRDGQLAEVEAIYDPARADTLIGGQPVALAHPADAPPYASGASWFIGNESVAFSGRRFNKYGLPRRISPRDLRPVGDYRGVPIFATRDSRDDQVLFVPIRSGCEFQAYQDEGTYGAVRG